VSAKTKELERQLAASQKAAAKASSDNERLLRIQALAFLAVLAVSGVATIILSIVGLVENVPLLNLIALPILTCGLGAFIFPWKGWRFLAGGVLVYLGIGGFAVLGLFVRPAPFSAHLPIVGPVTERSYQDRLEAVRSLLGSGEYSRAKQEAESLEEDLRGTSAPGLSTVRSNTLALLHGTVWPAYFDEQVLEFHRKADANNIDGAFELGQTLSRELAGFTDARLKELFEDVRDTLGQTVAPKWYASVKVWREEKGELWAWDETSQRPIRIYSFSDISEWRRSPDDKRIAVIADSRCAAYVVNKDRTHLVRVLTSRHVREIESGRLMITAWRDKDTLELRNPGLWNQTRILTLNEFNAVVKVQEAD